MIKTRSLIAIVLLAAIFAEGYRPEKISESYYAHRIATEPQQIYSSYFLHFEGHVLESHSSIAQEASILKEQTIPVEFVRYLAELSEIEGFTIELGFGNWNILSEVTQIEHNMPNAGTTLRVKTASSPAYLKLVKLLSGFFNTEIDRPSWQVFPIRDFDGEEVIYHNSGSNSLNFNMFRKILNFVNYRKAFTMVSLLNYMASFESDYVSFVLRFDRTQENTMAFYFEINLIFREVIMERLFNKAGTLSLKRIERSVFFNPEQTDLKTLDNLDAMTFKTLIKRAKPIYTLQGRVQSARNDLSAQLHLAKPFTALKNEMVFNLANNHNKSRIDFVLHLVFSPAEMPIIGEISFDRLSGSFTIDSKSLNQFYEKTNHSPGHLIALRGRIEVGCKMRLRIPYQQVHRNFETINSEHVINYIIPASTIEYRREGGQTFTKNFNNIAYKSKNYDTTVVFAIISVYLVILFFMFNSITKIKEDEKAK